MRRYDPLDRIISNELTATNVDAPQGTLVLEGCEPSITAALELSITSGTVTTDGSSVDVTTQSATVTELNTDEYRYAVLSVDGTGTLVVQEGDIGTLDSAGSVDNEVSEPTYPEGNVYLGTAIQFDDGLNTLWDGRYLWTHTPNTFPTVTADNITSLTYVNKRVDGGSTAYSATGSGYFTGNAYITHHSSVSSPTIDITVDEVSRTIEGAYMRGQDNAYYYSIEIPLLEYKSNIEILGSTGDAVDLTLSGWGH